jgi:cytochrome c
MVAFTIAALYLLPANHLRIKRYNTQLALNFYGVFFSSEFDVSEPYKFTFDSHCKHCHILQGSEKIKLNCVGAFSKFNS